MSTDEVLAISRLRQWAADRISMKHGRTMDYTRQGWRERRNTAADARLVRVLDFEHALSQLRPEHQSILVLTYRDHLDQRSVADASGISVRALSYKLPDARHALATMLDRLDLL